MRPLSVYAHPKGVSITGGFVYRGRDVPALRGYYVYADYSGGWIRGIKLRRSGVPLRFEKSGAPGGITSFGEDSRGNLYVCTYDGVYRIVT